MADPTFHHKAQAVSLEEIANFTGATIEGAGGERRFSDVAPLETAGPDDISFLDNIKYLEAFAASQAGACFVRPKYAARAPGGMALLITEAPYAAYALAARRLYPVAAFEPGISRQAVIAKNAILGKGARVDAGAVIGENVIIGERCWIGAHTVIMRGVTIGNDCVIGALCTLSHSLIGNRVVIHRGAHIGQDGFGFAPTPQGALKVPQLGRVVIGNDVEIGSGTCIDRGSGPDTTIDDFSKIDNLVQIGHNVKIGRHVMIAAQVGLAGSTAVEDGALLGGQVGVAGHVTVGQGAKLAAQAGIMTDVPPGETYGGSPAVPVRDWHRQTVAVANLVKKKDS